MPHFFPGCLNAHLSSQLRRVGAPSCSLDALFCYDRGIVWLLMLLAQETQQEQEPEQEQEHDPCSGDKNTPEY